jgi:hypothetical protein
MARARTYTDAVQWLPPTCREGRPTRWGQVSRQDVQQWMMWLLKRYGAAYVSSQRLL